MRRRASIVVAVVAASLVACGGDSEEDGRPSATATSADREPAGAKAASCRAPAKPTPAQTEGPYYKEDPPRRRNLREKGVRGRPLDLRGRVLTSRCRALAGARVDVWQADGAGEYDNEGYRLRGYQLTNRAGRYRVQTVVPARYEARTRHIHVKVTPRGGRTLITQLYFPGEPANRDDPIYSGGPVLRITRRGSAWRAEYDFVVR